MSLEKIIEEQIRKAMAEGEFENLSGKGKPLDLENYFKTPESLRLAYSILKSGQFVPQEVALLKEIEELESQLQVCKEDRQKRRLSKIIQEKTLSVRVLLETQKRKK
jgi:hypothetical protein